MNKISIPFYFIAAIFFIVGAYYLIDYLYDIFEIASYKNYVKIPKGAKVEYVTMDIVNSNILGGLPLINLITKPFSRGLVHTVLVQYRYKYNGETYVSRSYDLLNRGFQNKLDAILEYDTLNESEYVDMYIHPTKNKPYLVLNSYSELGFPWAAVFCFILGFFFLYGGRLIPDAIKTVPEKIYNKVGTKVGFDPIKIESTEQGVVLVKATDTKV